MSLSLALLLASGGAGAQEPLFHDADVRRALDVLARDAAVEPEQVRPAPLYFGRAVDVVGGLAARPCEVPVSGQVLADALRDAEAYATLGAREPTLVALDAALGALGCLDVPLRSWEAARVHDLASAVHLGLLGDAPGAVRHAVQALLFEPQHAFQLQVDAAVLEEARTRVAEATRSTLLLPPGIWRWRVLVDGHPAEAAEVELPAGEHVVQVLGAPVVTLRVEVGTRAGRAALLVPDLDLAELDLDQPAAQRWLQAARARWGGGEEPAWVVVRGRLWHVDADGGWQRYEPRPPRVLRPVFLGLTAGGVAAGGAVAAVGWSRWADLATCGTPDAAAGCAPFVDAASGLIVDADGWGEARDVQRAAGIAGLSAAVVSGSLLALVASRSRAPHPVGVSLLPTADGLQLTLAWVPR
ncbi:MAG: hypothetical protein H6732_14120 [Alphaproteobacteria bacterium]|nr:hypothetical protein [Alphaproteobacteria bacterium]